MIYVPTRADASMFPIFEVFDGNELRLVEGHIDLERCFIFPPNFFLLKN